MSSQRSFLEQVFSLRRMLIIAGVGVILSLGAVMVTVLASVTRSDALQYLKLADVRLSEAVPGQFYLVTNDGDVREPLCNFEEKDFAPRYENYPQIKLNNNIGDALPVLVYIWNQLIPLTSFNIEDERSLTLHDVEEFSVRASGLLRTNRKILGSTYNPDALKDEPSDAVRQAARYQSCADTVTYFVEQTPMQVCQLYRLVKQRGNVLGGEFATLCLTRVGGETVFMPEVAHPSIWTRMKVSLGLITEAF
jgi:hypothetical protein